MSFSSCRNCLCSRSAHDRFEYRKRNDMHPFPGDNVRAFIRATVSLKDCVEKFGGFRPISETIDREHRHSVQFAQMS